MRPKDCYIQRRHAGVEHFGALETITQADFDRLFQTNVAGQLFATQAAVAAMTDGGRIVLSSSVSVRLAVYQHALYAASKAAISAMVRNLAPQTRLTSPAPPSKPTAAGANTPWTVPDVSACDHRGDRVQRRGLAAGRAQLPGRPASPRQANH